MGFMDRALYHQEKEGRPLQRPSAAGERPSVRPGLLWGNRRARTRFPEPGAHKRRLATMLHRMSPWSMPAFNTLVPCTLMFA
jgi:hypothetical protein